MVLSEERVNQILEENNMGRTSYRNLPGILTSSDIRKYKEGDFFHKFEHSHNIKGLITCIYNRDDIDINNSHMTLDCDTFMKYPGKIDIIWCKSNE